MNNIVPIRCYHPLAASTAALSLASRLSQIGEGVEAELMEWIATMNEPPQLPCDTEWPEEAA